MRILLDTNIFIYREDDELLSDNIQELSKILSQKNSEVLIHPSSLEDVKRDRDERRRHVMLSKIHAYPILDNPPDPNKNIEYTNKVGVAASIHGQIDNKILYSVYKDAVDFLITEDRGIHKKARDLNINDRVLLIDDAVRIFEDIYKEVQVVTPPALHEDYVYNLDLSDPIFDSLKEEYHPEFEDWFKKISKEPRKCWVHYRENGKIGALLIYKSEDDSISDTTPKFAKERRLKICTFKVTHVGQKIGELFIKLSVDFALKNNLSEIYLTHFTQEEDRLVELITEYGFHKVGVKDKVGVNGKVEEVFIKKLIIDSQGSKSLNPIDVTREFYPSFYDGAKVKKFIVPIYPEYHIKLFTDFPKRQQTLTELAEFVVEGNTIKKAYISHSRIRQISPGDLVIFYRSKDMKKITSIGVVDDIYLDVENTEDIIKIVLKRTVYSREELEEMRKPVMIILFRHHFHLNNPLDLGDLIDIGVLSGPPQSITEISHEKYIKIRDKGRINERYTVH
jgi:predicted nucleic acid-binding protein